MSRTQPTIILESVTDNKALQVCQADSVFAVTYMGNPIMVRNIQDINCNYPGPKYAKSTYTNPGHAFNLAEKLNQTFDTNQFNVMKMEPGRVLREKS